MKLTLGKQVVVVTGPYAGRRGFISSITNTEEGEQQLTICNRKTMDKFTARSQDVVAGRGKPAKVQEGELSTNTPTETTDSVTEEGFDLA